jgi:hypothetical protein
MMMTTEMTRIERARQALEIAVSLFAFFSSQSDLRSKWI